MRLRPSDRRGVTLLMVVACVSLLVIVFGALLRLGFAERSQARSEERRLRAVWLAESGLERAWAKLATSRAYRGEAWELSAETLKGRDSALVRITVTPINDQPNRLRVTSRADYPRDGTSRSRQSRSAVFSMPIDSNAAKSGDTQ